MIWSQTLPDGTQLEISVALLTLEGYRDEREYLVVATRPGGGRRGICKLGENGIPKEWYQVDIDRKVVEKALEEVPNILLVEQVSSY